LPEKKSNGTNSNAAIALGTDPALAILESGGSAALCPLGNVYCMAEHDDMGIFADQVVAMRTWMKDHGQQNKPLILSEYSLLYPNDYIDEYGVSFPVSRINQFMIDSFNYLETATDPSLGYPADNNRLVQQWLWYSMNDNPTHSPPPNPAPNKLVEDDYSDFTFIGDSFGEEVAARPFTSNLFIGQSNFPSAKTITPTGTVSVTLSAKIFNNGNTPTTLPVTVNFYADAAKSTLIESTIVPAGLGGCARHSFEAQIEWDNLNTGVHYYWVEVAGGNTVSGFVIVNPEQVYLPAVMR
jgi:hypothetical protein